MSGTSHQHAEPKENTHVDDHLAATPGATEGAEASNHAEAPEAPGAAEQQHQHQQQDQHDGAAEQQHQHQQQDQHDGAEGAAAQHDVAAEQHDVSSGTSHQQHQQQDQQQQSQFQSQSQSQSQVQQQQVQQQQSNGSNVLLNQQPVTPPGENVGDVAAIAYSPGAGPVVGPVAGPVVGPVVGQSQGLVQGQSQGLAQGQQQGQQQFQDSAQNLDQTFTSGQINFNIETPGGNDFLKEMLECQMKINRNGPISMDQFFQKLHDCEIQNITNHKIKTGFNSLLTNYVGQTITSLTSDQNQLIKDLTQICGSGNSGFNNDNLNPSEFIQYIDNCVKTNPDNKEPIIQKIKSYLKI
jgi:hypothetical protein